MFHDLYRLEGLDSEYPKISGIIAFLELTKYFILEDVKNLSIEQLDYNYDQQSNSIGTLLKHVAFMEFNYQLVTFEGRRLNDVERQVWDGAIPGQLIRRSISNNSFSYYKNLWDSVRMLTISRLKEKNDDWLYMRPTGEFANWGNNYFCWLHVLHDQCCHHGQIKISLKRMYVDDPKQDSLR